MDSKEIITDVPRPNDVRIGIPDASAKARRTRCRRLELRQLRSATDGPAPLPPPPDNGSEINLVSKDLHSSVPNNMDAGKGSSSSSGKGVVCGHVAMMGRMRVMEDAVTLVAPPEKQMLAGGYSFFAVYDGHGGATVAETCSKRLHKFLEQHLEKYLKSPPNMKKDIDWVKVMTDSFKSMDEEIASDANDDKAERMMGSTATVVLVGIEDVIVANCGDSRAVLCRGGLPVPLSTDHKADRPDEKERVEAAGGMILNWNGWRVQGILATSRSLGDHYLKPYVSSEPEVTVVRRTDSDEFFILATDGLWDVMCNEVACRVVRKSLNGRCRRRCQPTDAGNRPREAAAKLAEMAVARGSGDNISIIVVQFTK